MSWLQLSTVHPLNYGIPWWWSRSQVHWRLPGKETGRKGKEFWAVRSLTTLFIDIWAFFLSRSWSAACRSRALSYVRGCAIDLAVITSWLRTVRPVNDVNSSIGHTTSSGGRKVDVYSINMNLLSWLFVTPQQNRYHPKGLYIVSLTVFLKFPSRPFHAYLGVTKTRSGLDGMSNMKLMIIFSIVCWVYNQSRATAEIRYTNQSLFRVRYTYTVSSCRAEWLSVIICLHAEWHWISFLAGGCDPGKIAGNNSRGQWSGSSVAKCRLCGSLCQSGGLKTVCLFVSFRKAIHIVSFR